MDENQVEFAPFAAINDFMRADFRQRVLTFVFRNLPKIAIDRKNLINQLTRTQVQVQGFRNPLKAPEPRLAKAAEKLFEENSIYTAQILQAWFEANQELAIPVFDVLSSMDGWDIFPLDVDRTQLPGFLVSWPTGYDFERLTKAFSEHFPEQTAGEDEVSLMVVWISMRLPYRETEE